MSDVHLPADDQVEFEPVPPKCTDAPDLIYLVVGDIEFDCTFGELHEVTWCADKIYDADIPYIRRDLAEEAARTIAELRERVVMLETANQLNKETIAAMQSGK